MEHRAATPLAGSYRVPESSQCCLSGLEKTGTQNLLLYSAVREGRQVGRGGQPWIYNEYKWKFVGCLDFVM
jgi:hypothetical protein